MKAILCLLYLTLALCVSRAASWYVDNAATGANSGLNWANAWTSFGAINNASVNPGDTIFLSGGSSGKTYALTGANGCFTYTDSGAIGNPITIRKGVDNGHNGNVIFRGAGISSGSINAYLELIGSDVVLDSLTFRPAINSGSLVLNGLRAIARNCTFEHGSNRTHFSWGALAYVAGNFCMISNATFRDMDEMDCIRMAGRNGVVTDCLVTNIFDSNRYADATGDGEHVDFVQVHGPGVFTGGVIERNFIINATVQPFQMVSGAGSGAGTIIRDFMIKNNVIMNTGPQANSAMTNCHFVSNIFWDCGMNARYAIGMYALTGNGYGVASGKVHNNVFIAPRIVNGITYKCVNGITGGHDFKDNYMGDWAQGSWLPMLYDAGNALWGTPGLVNGGPPRLAPNLSAVDFHPQAAGILARIGVTSSSDMSAPIISGRHETNRTPWSAALRWITSEPATNIIRWGLSASPYENTNHTGSTFETAHQLLVTNLLDNRTYNWSVTSIDRSNNVATSANQTFQSAVIHSNLAFIPAESGVLGSGNAATMTANAFGWISQASGVTTTISDAGTASWWFYVPNPHTYTLTGMVQVVGSSDNSLFIDIDNVPVSPSSSWDILTPTGPGVFAERVVSWRGNSGSETQNFYPKMFYLVPGVHELIVRGREPNMQIDRWAFSSVAQTNAPPPPVIIEPPPPTGIIPTNVFSGRIIFDGQIQFIPNP